LSCLCEPHFITRGIGTDFSRAWRGLPEHALISLSLHSGSPCLLMGAFGITVPGMGRCRSGTEYGGGENYFGMSNGIAVTMQNCEQRGGSLFTFGGMKRSQVRLCVLNERWLYPAVVSTDLAASPAGWNSSFSLSMLRMSSYTRPASACFSRNAWYALYALCMSS
jgi:hypothetical protein